MYLQAFSIDIAVDPMSGYVLIASDQTQGQNWVYVMNPTSFVNYGYMSMSGTWADGSSILKNPDRTLMGRGSCNSFDLQLFKGDSPTGDFGNVATWNISRSEAQFSFANGICP